MKLTKAPTGWNKAPSYVINEGGSDLRRVAYVIKGSVYVATTPPPPHTEKVWNKLGPAPASAQLAKLAATPDPRADTGDAWGPLR